MRSLIALTLVAAGCGSAALPDPCADASGSCVALTVTSASVTSVDTLHLIVSGAISGTRDSAKGQISSLPISLAITPGASAVGAVHLVVEGLVAGNVLGVGEADFTLVAGQHLTVTVDLKGGQSAPDLSASPDLLGEPPGADLSCGDVMNDVTNCGTCGHDCTKLAHVTGAGVTCSAGKCVVPNSACATGFAHCSANVDDGCEADLSQASHCGTCATNCGASAPLCAANGSTYGCVANCPAPTPNLCGASQCVDLTKDVNNCMTCGHACSFANAGATCMTSTCTIGACNTGYKDCVGGPANGCETYVLGADVNNCGDCSVHCMYAHGTAACMAGTCKLSMCDFGFGDCVNGPADGCETNTTTDAKNCGGCGSKCGYAQSCGASACSNVTTSCSASGQCLQANCDDVNHFAVTPAVAVDLANGRRLWQRAYQGMITYTNANNYCAGLNLDGLTGWRIPSLTELNQITLKPGGLMGCAAGYCCPSLNQSVFVFGTQPTDDLFWSNNQYMAGIQFCENFDDGRSTPWKEDVTASHNVRCTHDPATGY